MAKNSGDIVQDERSERLYGKSPIVVGREIAENALEYFRSAFNESLDWYSQNYEQDHVRYRANYLSIPGEVNKPWDDANDYFMPSTQTVVENYLSREMETTRGGRNFLTVFPRGKDDADKAKAVQMLLRYYFQTPMNGFKHLTNYKRWRYVYGTSIATIPWRLHREKQFVPGTYIFDRDVEDWIREIPEESVTNSSDPEGMPPPKDFSGINVESILESNEDYVIRDLYQDVTIEDSPKLELQEIFNVKLDPNGGPDIKDHRFTIVESISDIDTLKRRAAEGIFDKQAVKMLEEKCSEDQSLNESDKNETNSIIDAYEDKTNDTSIKGGVKIWTCYGKYALEEDGFEEEVIAIIANGDTLLRLTQTPYVSNGVPYRPLVMDHFIEDPHRPYGIGICQILESMNYALNHGVNMIFNHGDMHNSPILIYPAEGQFQPEDYVWGPGQSWSSDNSDGFRFLQAPDIKASQIQMITFLEGFIQKTLGINDFTLGQASGSIVNNNTAHGLANILRETNRRLDFYTQSSNEGAVKDIYTIMLKELQEFMDEREIARITDSEAFEFETILPEDIQGLFDLEIFADSMTASKEFEQLKSQNFIQVLTQLQDPQTGAPIYDTKKLGDKFIEAHGEPFPSNYYNSGVQEAKAQAQMIGLELGPGATQEEDPNTPSEPASAEPDEGRLGPI